MLFHGDFNSKSFLPHKLSVLSQVSRISDRKQGEAGLTEIHTFLNTMFGGEYFFSAANENM